MNFGSRPDLLSEPRFPDLFSDHQYNVIMEPHVSASK